MNHAVGSIETRPWLPAGLHIGWIEEQKSEPSDKYVQRKGQVVIVKASDREQVVASHASAAAAETWARQLTPEQVEELTA